MNKILLLLALCISLFAVQPLTIGSSLNIFESYEFETPKGYIVKVPTESTLILLSFEKDTGDMVNDYLKTQNKYYTQKNHTVFISDISKLPKVIRNMFVLPKMKEFKHLTYLHYGKKLRDLVPHKNERVTLLRIKDGEITNIAYAKTTQNIKDAIEQ